MKRKPFMFRLAYGTMQRAFNVGGNAMLPVAALRLARACKIGGGAGYGAGAAFVSGIGQGITDARRGPK